MTPLLDREGVRLYCAPWQDLRGVVDACDAVIVDAPYSPKTHAGHDGGTAECKDESQRRAINYAAWSPDDVAAFVAAYAPICTGWFVTITDHILAPVWSAVLEAHGRYVFAPLPFVAPGAGVRLSGDGPSSWTCWIVVARPRTDEFRRWGTLPGAYVLPPRMSERKAVVGGKPSWLLEQLVRDYSRPGGLIVDPCCGAGTAGVAALRQGRRAVLGDVSADHCELAAQWLRNPTKKPPNVRPLADEGGQGLLL